MRTDRLSAAAAGLALAAALLALLPGCSKKPAQIVQQPAGHVTVEYVAAGTEALVPQDYSANPNLHGAQLADYAATQLLAGPSTARDSVVLFPEGTVLNVTVQGDTAVVDITGPLAKRYNGGAEDESALFKSLTYTLTEIPGIEKVQVTVGGRTRAALSGGHFELDQPLTRETFAQ
jgi:spore germination protein GerM